TGNRKAASRRRPPSAAGKLPNTASKPPGWAPCRSSRPTPAAQLEIPQQACSPSGGRESCRGGNRERRIDAGTVLRSSTDERSHPLHQKGPQEKAARKDSSRPASGCGRRWKGRATAGDRG